MFDKGQLPAGARRTPLTSDIYSAFPLDQASEQIRIFTLAPSADKDEPLRGSIQVVNFAPKPPPYEALSYVWGEPSKCGTLLIAGHYLPLAGNLLGALRQIRHHSIPRKLWIDSICIDQSSPTDKNHQVKRMHDIYSRASRVIIWLGGADRDTDVAMDLIKKYGEDMRGVSWQDKVTDEEMRTMKTILNRPWWHRMWTLQEGLAANIDSLVLCGHRKLEWDTVLSSIYDLDRLRKDSMAGLLMVQRLAIDRFKYDFQTYPMVTLLKASASREASEPRDHIFALAGLMPKIKGHDFRPDYSRPVSWAYQLGTFVIFHGTGDLRFLAYRARQRTKQDNSWSIDFSTKAKLELMQAERDLNGWICNIDLHRKALLGQSINISHQDVEAGSVTIAGTVIGTIANTITDSATNTSSFSSNTSSFSTDTDYQGMGSPRIQLGDVLCVLFTCYMPLVLRPQPNGSYKLVDAVYVDNIMAGEFLETSYVRTTFVLT